MMDRLLNFLRPSEVAKLPTNREVGWAESSGFFRFSDAKINPDDLIGRKGHKIYRKMMLDEQVKAVVKFKRDAITSRDWYFEFESDVELSDKEIEYRINIYNKMVSVIRGSFNDGLNYIMTAMYQGFSMTEIILDTFEYKGTPYVGFSKLSPKPYDTFEFETDKFGKILRVVQEIDGEEQDIDLSKFVYFVQNPEFDQHYGQSELREAYRAYYSKDIVLKLYSKFLERMSGGFIEAKPKEGTVLRANSADYLAIKALIDNLQSASSVLIPSNIELTMHSPTSTDQFEKALTMYDLQIAKALLVPNLLGVTHQGDTGSYSQADRQLEAFLWTLDADASRLADAMNEQMFDPLSELNFADGIGPKFKFKPVSEEKKMQLIAVWSDLVKASAVEVTDTDEEHLRELLDFPEKGEPIKKPVVPTIPGTGSENPSSGDGNPDESPDSPRSGETIVGEERRRVVSNVAFSRALKRVSFTVIDRKSADLEEQHSSAIEQELGAMVLNLTARIREEKLGTPAGSIKDIGTIDFAMKDKTKARRSIDAALRDAWRLGVRHSRDEVSKARKEAFKLDMARIEEDAAEFLKTNGFRMMGNLVDDMKKIVLNILMNGVKFSWTTDDIVNKIFDSLTLSGFMSLATNSNLSNRTEEALAEALQEAKLNAHRVRTAVRTNTFEAINEARYSAFTDPELDGFVEALEYSAILDDRTTEICRHLDGRIYPTDSPHWNSIRPPNHYNCRSILVPVTVVDTDVTGKDKERGESRWSKAPRKDPQRGFGGEVG